MTRKKTKATKATRTRKAAKAIKAAVDAVRVVEATSPSPQIAAAQALRDAGVISTETLDRYVAKIAPVVMNSRDMLPEVLPL